MKKDIDYNENKKEIMKQIVDRIQDNENRHLKDRKKNLLEKENMLKEKIDKIKTKQEKYQKIYEKNKKQIMQKRQEMSHPKTAINRDSKKNLLKNRDMQTYTLYDVRTKYEPNKGWTMGMKYTYNPNKNKDDPDFPNLKSEFEKIVNNPKYAEIKYTAPRFKEEKIVKPSNIDNSYDDMKKNEKIKRIRERSERNVKIKKFLDEQKENIRKVQDNKEKIKEARENELEDLKDRILKSGYGGYDNNIDNIDYIDINYNLVEEASPNYTMKGRYKHGSIFDMPDNYSVVNNEDEEEENKIGSNGKPIQDEEYKKSLPVPQYNVVKPSYPIYSFSKANRFYSKPLYQPSPNAVPVIPFQNGKFKPDDYIKFSSGMGKAKKDNVLRGNGIPGPGQYKIKGFAEVLVEKAQEANEKRERKKREREMRKREDEKNFEKTSSELMGKNNGQNMVMKLSDDFEDDSREIAANRMENIAHENNNENQKVNDNK